MFTLEGKLTLKQVVEQGFAEIRQEFLGRFKRTIEGLLEAERDRRIVELRQQGEKVYRWGYTIRKCWQTLWGALEQVRVPRLRGRAEVGLLERYQRHALEGVLFALTVGGLSQRKVVAWVRRFLGGRLSPATIGAVLAQAQQDVERRRQVPLHRRSYVALVVDGVYLRYRRCFDDGPRQGVLLIAVGVRADGSFQVLDWLAAPSETAAAYEQLFMRLFQRGLDEVALMVSDGAEAITAAAAMVYPGSAHQLCLVHWFRLLEDLTPPLDQARRRKFRREFWWLWEADDESQLRRWAASFCRRWRFWAPQMVEKFQAELHRVVAYLHWPVRWRHRLRTTNLAEGFFRHLRKYLGRFPGCVDPAHSEHILGCFILACEQAHA
ncbi:MAG: transposase [Acidobacteria bacterium]|nr:transposase [Acidobacteriota bacterium]